MGKKLKIAGIEFDFSKRTYIMGILNVTPDSFSDGGNFFDCNKAIKHAIEMVDDGADIIDIGGESTRPGSLPVSADEEINRVIPVIKGIKDIKNIPISIDSCKPEVLRAALAAGADMINDVCGLRDPDMVALAGEVNVPTCIMHMLKNPKDMQESPRYNDVVEDISNYLIGQANKAIEAGLSKEKIIIDPGIGFGKTLEHNLEIIRRLKSFKKAGYPLLLGTSRKSFIGKILDSDTSQRLEGTLATIALGIANGADIIRVHDIRQAKRAAMVSDAIVGKT